MQSDQKIFQKRSTSMSNLNEETPLKINFNPQFMGSEHSGTISCNSVVAQTVGKNLQKAYQEELSKQEHIKHHLRVNESGRVQEMSEYNQVSAAKKERPTSATTKKQSRFGLS